MRPNRLPLILETGCGAVAGAALTIALVSMAAQVVFRYLIGSSLVWSEEVARYALIWSTMIGAAAAYQRGGHMAMTVVVDRLPPRAAALAYRIIHLIVIGFAGLVAWQGLFLTLRNFDRNQLSTALQMQIAWVYLAIPVGALLIALAAVNGLWRGLAPSRQEG